MPLIDAAPTLHPSSAISPLPSAPRRPGESYERAAVSAAAKRSLAVAGAQASVPLDVAATLICEAGLLLDRLGRRRLADPRSLLDQAASRSRGNAGLSAAGADYLRALSRRSWRRHGGEPELPVRVLARLGDDLEGRLGRTDLLEHAIRWEIGSLLGGSSIGSWGCEVALAGFRRPP